MQLRGKYILTDMEVKEASESLKNIKSIQVLSSSLAFLFWLPSTVWPLARHQHQTIAFSVKRICSIYLIELFSKFFKKHM